MKNTIRDQITIHNNLFIQHSLVTIISVALALTLGDPVSRESTTNRYLLPLLLPRLFSQVLLITLDDVIDNMLTMYENHNAVAAERKATYTGGPVPMEFYMSQGKMILNPLQEMNFVWG